MVSAGRRAGGVGKIKVARNRMQFGKSLLLEKKRATLSVSPLSLFKLADSPEKILGFQLIVSRNDRQLGVFGFLCGNSSPPG